MSRVCDLMASKGPQSGHNVSHSNRKTHRVFKPNLQYFTLDSEVFRRKFRLRLTASTMRTVLKHNGLDGFLRNVKTAKLTPAARKLKKDLFAIEGAPKKVVHISKKKAKTSAKSTKKSTTATKSKEVASSDKKTEIAE